MPFKSEAQRRFMYSQHPELAKEFESATPKGADLPEHAKKMADGGPTTAADADKFDPGMKDASVSDFLLPYLLGPSSMRAAEEAPAVLKGLGEAGEVTMGRAAPAMEEAANPNEVTAFVKGIQKGAPGSEGVKIYGVKGSPAKLKELFGDEAPGSVPENILREKGILPPQVNIPRNAPNAYADGGVVEAAKNLRKESQKADDIDPVIPTASTDTKKSYAEGGKVERSSLEHQVPNGMMARAMSAGGYDKGGYPHVTFLENEKFPAVKKDVHLDKEASKTLGNAATGHKENYADGGYPHVSFLENESPSEMKKDTHMEGHKAGPMDTTETGEKENPAHMADGGKTPHFLEGLKKGALHKEMGVPESETIPAKKLEHAANSDNETLRKRAQFAINAKKFHRADGGVIPHEEKLHSIYKAMGIKKYADGGEVDTTQLPSPAAPPSQNDPGFWDSIKAALAQAGKPFMAPGIASAASDVAATPGIAPAINTALGTNLPGPEATPAPAPVVPPPAVPPVVAAPKPVAPVASVPAPSGPNLNTLFNQDTSKLTAGVNPEDRQALANKLQEQQHGIGSVIAQAVAGLGDALAAKGGKEQHSLQNIFAMEKTQRDEALANFDKARQDRIQKLALQTQMGQNSIQQLAAQDAYGTDEHLNKMLGAPPGTAHKDLPLYFQAKAAQVAQQEKDADLYMKAHAQASADVDNAVKNASVLGVKPSAAQLQASGAKLADNYFNRAKGNLLVHTSDGQNIWLPAASIAKAKQLDPNLQVQP